MISRTLKFGAAVVAAVIAVVFVFMGTFASAAPSAVGLGTASSFAVLAGAGVTNTGPSVINGDLGTCPNPSVIGFPPGIVNGSIYAGGAVACQAQSDLTVAYNDAAGRPEDVLYAGPTDLGVQPPLVAGVYESPSSFAITGTVTLDGQGDPSSVWIFQAGSTLITATNSRVAFVNGASACNVFWKVGSSATLGTGTGFAGTILALTSITANTNATVTGRLLARNGTVTLDANTINNSCAPPTPPTSSSTTSSSTTSSTTSSSSTTTSSTTPGATTSTTAPGGPTTTLPAPTTTQTTRATTTTVSTPTTVAPATSTSSGAPPIGVAPSVPGGGSPSAPAAPAPPASSNPAAGVPRAGPDTAGPEFSGSLPHTGPVSAVAWQAVAGLALIALGFALVAWARPSRRLTVR